MNFDQDTVYLPDPVYVKQQYDKNRIDVGGLFTCGYTVEEIAKQMQLEITTVIAILGEIRNGRKEYR